jgi:U5 small nuclear ribonucleoprotein component
MLSLKAVPVSLVLPDTSGKHFLLNVVDTPGHASFQDEVTVALRLADGVIVVVDCISGLTAHVRRLLQQCVAEELPVVVVINQIDRLILELRVPPTDAYHKLRHVLAEINTHLTELYSALGKEGKGVDPIKGSVVFASTKLGVCFTLESFARVGVLHSFRV